MIKKILNLKQRGILKKYLSVNEAIIDVYFLVESNNQLHWTTILIRTNKGMLYVGKRDIFALNYEDIDTKNAIINLLKNIFSVSPDFNDFHIFCAEKEFLDELEDETILEYCCCPFKLKTTDCSNISEYKRYFEKVKNEALKGINDDNFNRKF